jgi:hypothetical protein
MRNHMLLIVTLGLLAACARVTVFGHTVKDEQLVATAAPPPAAAARGNAAAAPAAQSPVNRISIEFTAEALKQVSDDERFNVELLRDALTAALRARQLLDLQPSGTGRVAVLRVDEFSVHATSNVVLFGHLPSAGVLASAVLIRDAGKDTREFHVRAEVAMNISRSGKDKNPLQKLYGGFATQLVDELAGTTASPRQHP